MLTRRWQIVMAFMLVIALLVPGSVAHAMGPPDGVGGGGGGDNGGGGRPGGEETAGNNLSYPVLWAEGVVKPLPTPPPDGEMLQIDGEWWYWWGSEGTDPNVVPLSCPPDPDDDSKCDDGVVGQATSALPPPNDTNLVKAYLQKDPGNFWEAESADVSAAPLEVHWVDWGDNLESVDWYIRSQVRTEVVLFQDLETPMREYEMRHTSGWGIDEVHGMVASVDDVVTPMDGMRATIYSPCARLTIQKLNVERDDARLVDLVWIPETGWSEPDGYGDDLINPAIFNGAVHEGGDGPGYYSAETNVKGRIIYGYTWNVRKLNEGAGDYRITFSFDDMIGETGPILNTFFVDGVTQIVVPIEEEAEAITDSDGGDTGGATPILDFDENLTYIDIRILERSGGGGNGGKGPPRVRSADILLESNGELTVDGTECLCDLDRSCECSGDTDCLPACQELRSRERVEVGDGTGQSQSQEQERNRERERDDRILYLPSIRN